MTTTLALAKLYTEVSASLAADGVVVSNVFGWRAVAQQTTSHMRIAWRPGDDGDDVGDTLAPRQPGRQPRSLATLAELCSVTITAYDASAPEDELAQYKLVRLLRDAWYRAVYRSAHGTFGIVNEKWLADRAERRYGASLRIVVSIEAAVFDEVPGELTALDPELVVDAVAAAQAGGDELTAQTQFEGEDAPDVVRADDV